MSYHCIENHDIASFVSSRSKANTKALLLNLTFSSSKRTSKERAKNEQRMILFFVLRILHLGVIFFKDLHAYLIPIDLDL